MANSRHSSFNSEYIQLPQEIGFLMHFTCRRQKVNAENKIEPWFFAPERWNRPIWRFWIFPWLVSLERFGGGLYLNIFCNKFHQWRVKYMCGNPTLLFTFYWYSLLFYSLLIAFILNTCCFYTHYSLLLYSILVAFLIVSIYSLLVKYSFTSNWVAFYLLLFTHTIFKFLSSSG